MESRFRFCPWCATPQRTKLVEHFLPSAVFPSERLRALRVSRYLAEGHVRFSIWDRDQARAAVSLDEEESLRLAGFLSAGYERRGAPSLRERVSAAMRAIQGVAVRD